MTITVEPTTNDDMTDGPRVRITDHNGCVHHQGFYPLGLTIFLGRRSNGTFGWVSSRHDAARWGLDVVATITSRRHLGRWSITSDDIHMEPSALQDELTLETQVQVLQRKVAILEDKVSRTEVRKPLIKCVASLHLGAHVVYCTTRSTTGKHKGEHRGHLYHDVTGVPVAVTWPRD